MLVHALHFEKIREGAGLKPQSPSHRSPMIGAHVDVVKLQTSISVLVWCTCTYRTLSRCRQQPHARIHAQRSVLFVFAVNAHPSLPSQTFGSSELPYSYGAAGVLFVKFSPNSLHKYLMSASLTYILKEYHYQMSLNGSQNLIIPKNRNIIIMQPLLL